MLLFLPGDPLAKVWRAVLQSDAPPFTAHEESDGFAVDQLYVLEVERYQLVPSVLVDQPLQLGNVFGFDVTAEHKPDGAGVDGTLDLEHLREAEEASATPPNGARNYSDLRRADMRPITKLRTLANAPRPGNVLKIP